MSNMSEKQKNEFEHEAEACGTHSVAWWLNNGLVEGARNLKVLRFTMWYCDVEVKRVDAGCWLNWQRKKGVWFDFWKWTKRWRWGIAAQHGKSCVTKPGIAVRSVNSLAKKRAKHQRLEWSESSESNSKAKLKANGWMLMNKLCQN